MTTPFRFPSRASLRPARGAALVAAIACLLLAASVRADVQVSVAKFSRNFDAAFVFTFDDALPSQLIYAAPYLDQVGLKGSFYLITNNVADGDAAPAIGRPTTWKSWKAVADSGHEIGSHTLTHPDLTKISSDSAAKELSLSAQVIKDKLGITPVTLAYPYNAWNPGIRTLMRKTYIAARESQVGYGDSVAGFAATTEAMNKYADDAVATKALKIGMIHGLTEPYAPMDPAQFLAHLKYCKQLQDQGKLWVARFCDISKYQKERDSLQISVSSKSANQVTFTANTSLDAATYDFPLTLMVGYDGAMPASATATRAGQSATLETTVQAGRILVQAVPGPQAITVQWSGVSAVRPRASRTHRPDAHTSSSREYRADGKCELARAHPAAIPFR